MGTGPVHSSSSTCKRLALGGEEESGLLGHAASPISTGSGPSSSAASLGPGGGHPRRARAHPVPRLHARRTATASSQALGPKITVQESPWDCVLAGDDEPRAKAVRRSSASAARSRWPSTATRRRRTSRDRRRPRRGGHPGAGHALGHAAGRAGEAGGLRARHRASRGPRPRRLLREAGIPDGYAFTLKNRAIPQPYEPMAIWLIDQWRQIGLNVKTRVRARPPPRHHTAQRRLRGGGGLRSAASSSSLDIDIAKFQSTGVSDSNYARYKDPVLDDLYLRQARALDPEERAPGPARLRERRLRTRRYATSTRCSGTASCPHSAKVRGWTITPGPLPQPAARHGMAGG